MLSLRAFPAVLALGLALAACQSVEKKAVVDQAEVVSDSDLVCKATAEVEKALDNVDDLTPASTVADAEAAGASLKKLSQRLTRLKLNSKPLNSRNIAIRLRFTKRLLVRSDRTKP